MTRPAILLIDDEPHSLSAMRMALEDEFDCLTAGDAVAAMSQMESEWVQVMICDQRMPGQTGVAFLTEVRERWPEVVRVIITGYTDAAAMAQAAFSIPRRAPVERAEAMEAGTEITSAQGQPIRRSASPR